ncbi:metal ABC transporter solute-binding protein, Zn/Mn family [Roseibium sp. RKSG952]|uniref:metal ABC transporter solute-binding protein, Zn/Mn family n=1 Tax=Roseibium sp. RKSG952 TaxID=2529384 RepID=UPI0012BD1A3C|nr:zinc ABC transporter substrate-binding protein [Roseibium sp. RKSG952]MTH95024.1 cation ABC transporter substrate-binding protein [Roseibium sp. RKSG952]
MNKIAKILLITIALFTISSGANAATLIKIVAAENFYGNVAKTIGGPQVTVTSILSNPNQDPHLFEADVETAKAVSTADIAIYSGADYDPWMLKLLKASPNSERTTIDAAALTGHKPGDNPHIWYDPKTIPAVAKALTADLSTKDSANAELYHQRLEAFLASLHPLTELIAKLKTSYAGTPVTATEPVFGYMAKALGLDMRNQGFQIAIMNNTAPSAKDVAAFENDLRNKTVKVLFYNSQVTDHTTTTMLNLAKENGIPVVGVTETEPANEDYVTWMTDQLDALNQALGSAEK